LLVAVLICAKARTALMDVSQDGLPCNDVKIQQAEYK
jgi:hypothetical protein